MLRALADWVTLYGHILRSRRSSDLLMQLSMALSWFWLLVFITPYIPFVEEIPWLDRIAAYATRSVFGFSLRVLILIILPLGIGILEAASDAFRRKRHFYPRTYGELRSGMDHLMLETGGAGQALLLLLLAVGWGWLAMFRWLVNQLFIAVSSVLDIMVEWSSGTALDSFLVEGRPQDLARLADFLRQGFEASGQEVTFSAVAVEGSGASGAVLSGLDHALGVHGYIRSQRVSIMVGDRGVAGTGDRQAVGLFYLRVRKKLPLHLLQCSHPDAQGPEEQLNASQPLPPGTLAALAGDENVTMGDIKVLARKQAVVEGRPFLPMA